MRLDAAIPTGCNFLFQSTHPLRGATYQIVGQHMCRMFQSTHPLRGATLFSLPRLIPITVSIHAPPARCDTFSADISFDSIKFQSTHPLRGATRQWHFPSIKDGFQSTHPCEVRLNADGNLARPFVSIHAPLRGATYVITTSADRLLFQSTHPARCDSIRLSVSIWVA